MTFPRHAEYKAVDGLPVGSIPNDWNTVRVRDIAAVINGYPFDSDLFTTENGLPLVRIRDLNRAETEVRYAGEPVESALIDSTDVLIGMDGDFNVGRWRGEGKALLNQRVCCVRGTSNILTRHLEYALPEALRFINDLTYSTTVKHLSSEQVKRIVVAVPPTDDELAAIVSFLDRETARIDALIAEQERLIALLPEKRQAVISHAVTKGRDPNVSTKDSGVQWIGRIPCHWAVLPVRRVAKLESGHTPSRQHPEYWENCTIPWFSLADIWQVRDGRIEEAFDTSEKVSELGIAHSAARLLPAGTVMLSRTASVGFSAIMGIPMATTQDFANWVCNDELHPPYLLYCFRSMGDEFGRLKMGSTHTTIYMPDIQKLTIPLPPLAEQVRIAEWIRDAIRSLDVQTDDANRIIHLLRERRTALITAAVTGQIDVRALASAG